MNILSLLISAIRLTRTFLIVAWLLLAAFPLRGDVTVSLPFNVELEEVGLPPGAPRLQSFCVGRSRGLWLFVAGRSSGIHTFEDNVNNFPPTEANRTAYVLEAASGKVLGFLDLAVLGPDLADPLSATNAQSLQIGTDLIIVGGYGLDSQARAMVTFDTVIRFNVDEVIKAVLKPAQPAELRKLFRKNHDERLKVAGGELKQLGSALALVFGHRFDGMYSINLRDYNRRGGMQQRYTQKVKVFGLNDDLSVDKLQLYGPFDSALPFNRRDLIVADMIRPDGTAALTVYGGVFLAQQEPAAHLNPVDIDLLPERDPLVDSMPGQEPALRMAVDKSFQQALSHYDCASFSVFDGSAKTMYTTLFGGISQFHYDAAAKKLIRDPVDLNKGIDGLPFIDTVSCIVRSPKGSTQYILPKAMPGLMGTEARFIPAPDVPRFANGVAKFGELKDRTVVGWIYGGIVARRPYPARKTYASAQLFRVYVTPGPMPVIPAPPIPVSGH
jgi:hypothetical protein